MPESIHSIIENNYPEIHVALDFAIAHARKMTGGEVSYYDVRLGVYWFSFEYKGYYSDIDLEWIGSLFDDINTQFCGVELHENSHEAFREREASDMIFQVLVREIMGDEAYENYQVDRDGWERDTYGDECYEDLGDECWGDEENEED